MADPTIVREWLSKADEDFSFAKINLEEDHKFYSQICFHPHGSGGIRHSIET
jgi:HEPN domain-containing protein